MILSLFCSPDTPNALTCLLCMKHKTSAMDMAPCSLHPCCECADLKASVLLTGLLDTDLHFNMSLLDTDLYFNMYFNMSDCPGDGADQAKDRPPAWCVHCCYGMHREWTGRDGGCRFRLRWWRAREDWLVSWITGCRCFTPLALAPWEHVIVCECKLCMRTYACVQGNALWWWTSLNASVLLNCLDAWSRGEGTFPVIAITHYDW